MANVTTTTSLGSLLLMDGDSLDVALENCVDFFTLKFSQADSDIFNGNFNVNSVSNSYLSAYVYGAAGTVSISGSGFYGNSGSISSIGFNGSGGSFNLSGSMKWNVNDGIYSGTIQSVEIHKGSDWVRETGNLSFDSSGNLHGTVTGRVVHTGIYTIEYECRMAVEDWTGTISKIKLYDNAGHVLTVTGSFDAAAYNAISEATTTPEDFLQQAAALFSGADTFIAPDNSRDWHGFAGNDKLTGGINNDTLFGDSENDSLFGLAGNDNLDGGTGADTMAGGAGDDTFYVDNALDKATENTNEGYDKVFSEVSYILSSNIEELELTGSQNINGTGNASNNLLIGNTGRNILNGGAGADVLQGEEDGDTYIIDTLADTVIESGGYGNDTVIVNFTNAGPAILIDLGTAAFSGIESATILGTGLFNINGTSENNTLVGNSSTNVLIGGDGNDNLDGGTGADSLDGGDGDDTYTVDNVADIISDSSGTDTVAAKFSSGTFVLSSGLENLTLLGTSSINGTGDAGINSVTGNTGANILDGGAGADILAGNAGNDTYLVDDENDTIIEVGAGTSGGTDIVKSNVNFVLSVNVENLQLVGISNISGTGNASVNSLVGNAGNNILDGAGGIDKLSGGLGNDTYLIDLIVLNGSAKLQDSLTESTNAGNDTLSLRTGGDLGLLAPTTLTLGTNLENLDASLTGTNKLNLTGNQLNNVLTGNDGNNILNGAAGADSLFGGNGDDTLFVDNVLDVLSGGDGTDTVQSAISWSLVASVDVENLTLTGSSTLSGTGNLLANIINGNSGANSLEGQDGNDSLFGFNGNDVLNGGLDDDILDGAAGVDTLTGGGGSDTFAFHAAQAGSASNADIVTDFAAGAGGDALDIHDILIGYAAGSISSFVQLSEQNGDTIVLVDKNGAVGGASFIKMATLQGVTGLNAELLLTDSNLIVT